MISKVGEFIGEFLVVVLCLFCVVAMIKGFTIAWGWLLCAF